ncbi:hypothetical protein A6E03_17490 [Aliivibrio sp. 1S128]|nr:hypothetical protein A6E03_17490 [Aliivibrio sp. 1S128]
MDYKNNKGQWALIIPISGLNLDKSIGEELTIDRVTFISVSKLHRVRKRFNLPLRINEFIDKRPLNKEIFESCKTVAIVSLGGKGCEKELELLEIVRKELSFISSSQLGYCRRKNNACLSLSSETRIGQINYMMLNLTAGDYMTTSTITGRFEELKVDCNWKKFQKSSFFFDFINLLNSQKQISSAWQKNIEDAVSLAGKSQSCSELSLAFLYNMIAIETLLTESGDKFSEMLPNRVEAFIGWSIDWDNEDYRKKIASLYQKRCRFVHAGDTSNIQIDDLLFSDNLLLNVLHNILKHIDIFQSKKDLISFSKKIEAEQLLNIKSKIRPKTIRYLNIIYSENDRKHT